MTLWPGYSGNMSVFAAAYLFAEDFQTESVDNEWKSRLHSFLEIDTGYERKYEEQNVPAATLTPSNVWKAIEPETLFSQVAQQQPVVQPVVQQQPVVEPRIHPNIQPQYAPRSYPVPSQIPQQGNPYPDNQVAYAAWVAGFNAGMAFAAISKY